MSGGLKTGCRVYRVGDEHTFLSYAVSIVQKCSGQLPSATSAVAACIASSFVELTPMTFTGFKTLALPSGAFAPTLSKFQTSSRLVVLVVANRKSDHEF